MFIKHIANTALVQGRYDGGNGISGHGYLARIDRETEQGITLLALAASQALHRLEAKLAHSQDRLAAMLARVAEYAAQGRPQSLGYGLLLLGTFVALLAAESYLLMPTMRGFGIAHPLHQMIAAASIVLVGAVLLKYVYEDARAYFALSPAERKGAPRWTMQRLLLPALAVFTIVLFIFLGIFRASEMIFAHQIDANSDLGRFVSEHEMLTKLTIALLTVALPIGGALALAHGIEITREWWRWMRARYLCWRHQRRVHQITHEIAATRERLTHQTSALRNAGESLKAEYEYGQEHGRRLGLHKMPAWFFVLKTAAVAAISLFLVYAVDQWLQVNLMLSSERWIFYGLLVAGVTAVYGVRQWLRRERPAPDDLRWRPRWANESAHSVTGEAEVEAATSKRPLSIADGFTAPIRG